MHHQTESRLEFINFKYSSAVIINQKSILELIQLYFILDFIALLNYS